MLLDVEVGGALREGCIGLGEVGEVLYVDRVALLFEDGGDAFLEELGVRARGGGDADGRVVAPVVALAGAACGEAENEGASCYGCLLYTSDAADE